MDLLDNYTDAIRTYEELLDKPIEIEPETGRLQVGLPAIEMHYKPMETRSSRGGRIEQDGVYHIGRDGKCYAGEAGPNAKEDWTTSRAARFCGLTPKDTYNNTRAIEQATKAAENAARAAQKVQQEQQKLANRSETTKTIDAVDAYLAPIGGCGGGIAFLAFFYLALRFGNAVEQGESGK